MKDRSSVAHARDFDFGDLKEFILTFITADMKERLKMTHEFLDKYVALEQKISTTNDIVLLDKNLKKLQEIRATFYCLLAYLRDDYTEHTLASFINLTEDKGEERQTFLDEFQEQQIQWNISSMRELEKKCIHLDQQLFEAEKSIRHNKHLIVILIFTIVLISVAFIVFMH